MNRKSVIIFVAGILTILVGTILLYKYVFTKPYLNIQNVQEISIIALPSPPKVKHVTRKEDIKIFVNYFNSISTAPTITQNLKGWEYKIQINNDDQNSIYLAENRLEFHGVWYSVNNNVIENMKKLYKNLIYPEENINNQLKESATQITYKAIKTYAKSFMEKYKSDVNLDNPIELYDVNDELVSLFFSDKNVGYIIVNIDDGSVPEFSPESNNKFIVDKTKKYYYNGPTIYMEELNNKIIDSKNKYEIGTLENLKLKLKHRKLYKPTKENVFSNDTNTLSNYLASKVKIITGIVPNYSYNPNGICGSTATAMFLKYYDIYINENFVLPSLESSDGVALIKKLVPYIDGNNPGSYPGQLETGLYDYLASQFINATIYMDYSNLGSISGVVGNNKPYILGLSNAPTYGDHWVTGYGYSGNYAIANDGWGSTGVYIDTSYTDFIIY